MRGFSLIRIILCFLSLFGTEEISATEILSKFRRFKELAVRNHQIEIESREAFHRIYTQVGDARAIAASESHLQLLKGNYPNPKVTDREFLEQIAAPTISLRRLDTMPAYAAGKTYVAQLLSVSDSAKLSSTLTELRAAMPSATIERWAPGFSFRKLLAQSGAYENVVFIGHGSSEWGSVSGAMGSIGTKNWRGPLKQLVEGRNVVFLGCNTGHCVMNNGLNPFHNIYSVIHSGAATSAVGTLTQISKGADTAFLRMMASGNMEEVNATMQAFTGVEGPYFNVFSAP